MARKLTAGVVIRHPGSGAVTFLAPGSDLPDWANGLVGDHVLEGAGTTKQPTPEPVAPPPGPARTAAAPPPKSGKGATDAAWTKYATDQGVAVTDSMTRSEVIAACDAAGVRTE